MSVLVWWIKNSRYSKTLNFLIHMIISIPTVNSLIPTLRKTILSSKVWARQRMRFIQKFKIGEDRILSVDCSLVILVSNNFPKYWNNLKFKPNKQFTFEKKNTTNKNVKKIKTQNNEKEQGNPSLCWNWSHIVIDFNTNNLFYGHEWWWSIDSMTLTKSFYYKIH